jgi:hypothetical protein
MLTLFTGLITLLSVVHAWEPDYVLRVGEETIYTDCSPRNSVVVNGTSPHHSCADNRYIPWTTLEVY